MTLKQALNVVNETKIHVVIEVKKGHFESTTIDYLGDLESLGNAQKFISKWNERKVSFIHYNKARDAIEIDCYMKGR